MPLNHKEFKSNFLKLIENKNKILITSHINPDDDSISSVLSMYLYLKKYLKKENIDIVYTGEYSERWNYFEGFDDIKSSDDVANNLSDYDAVICLDGSQFYRFSHDKEKFEQAELTKICIDHHSSEIDRFDLTFIDKDSSSCAEIIYRIFYGEDDKIDSRICETILLGIIGDTGTFRYIKPSQADAFDVVKKLLVDGNIDIQILKSKYEGFSQECYEVVKEYVKNSQIINLENIPNFIITYIDYDFIEEKKLSDPVISEARSFFVDNFTRSFRGITWGMVLYPIQSDNSIKVSMRSLPGSTNVRMLGERLAEKYNGQGGGHDRAGGCSFLGIKPDESVKDYTHLIIDYLDNNPIEIS